MKTRFSSLLYPVVASCLLALGGCASLSGNDALQVTVAGVESLPGEGFELRLLVKLRVQNPNDAPIEYTGVYVKLDVQGSTFASGVSDEQGTVPRFGETVVAVPVTVSVLRMVRQVIGVLDGEPVKEIRYEMSGKLHGGAFSTARFRSEGTFELPQTGLPQTEPEVLDPEAGT
jgi:LEA14-like dessication related protein